MELGETIVIARKNKGLTQEQLADLTNITVRTIQRIESGESNPRAYTLKTIAEALDIRFEELKALQSENPVPPPVSYNEENGRHFLQMLCLSCFTYLCIPFIHFLVPSYMLKRSTEENPKVIAFARRVLRGQLYWKSALWLIMLLTLAYNLIVAIYFKRTFMVNYLWPFFIMYFLNAVIITVSLLRIKRTDFSFNPTI